MSNSKEWFGLSELSAGFPGLPSSVRGLAKKAKREGWQSRKRHARGGGYEYHISSLPQEAQKHFNGKGERPPNLNCQARLFIADHWRNFVLMNKFCEAYNDGLLDVQGWVKGTIPSISVADLEKFICLYKRLIGPV